MLINFRNIRDGQDPVIVRVERNRFRGTVVENNIFVLYRRRTQPNAFGLFIEPDSSDYTARELGGRLMYGDGALAETIVTGGWIRMNRDPPMRVVNFEFMHASFVLEKVGHLIALGFNHDDVSDFRDARVTSMIEPFLKVATVAELIRQYIEPNGNPKCKHDC
ncbi:MAG: hypothetical protein MN733_28370 [Nitrososphaera sp.]|nr:hypothetical protein [Nitrososphaera sp.]